MDHQVEPRQVDAARGHVGGDADLRAPVAQRLQRVGALLLAELARQRHGAKAAVAHPRQQVVHVGAGLAEHDGGARVVETQQVEDGVLAVAQGDAGGAIGDVAVLARLSGRDHAQGVALELGRQPGDGGRHGGRKHQRAALGRGGLQDELQILAEAEVQHLVGFVQHAGAQGGQVQAAAFQMIAQPPRRADDDLRAAVQRPALGAEIHAADAGSDLRPGPGVKPAQLARHLQRQLARGGDGQRHRQPAQRQLPVVEDVRGHRQPEAHGLARAGLRRHQQVAPGGFGGQHRLLDRGEAGIALGSQGRGQRRGEFVIGHCNQPEGDGAHPWDGT